MEQVATESASEVAGNDFASPRSARLERQLGQLCLYQISHFRLRIQSVLLTLAASPTQPDSTAPNRETLHLFDRPLSIWFADELNESAVFPSRNLDLYIRTRAVSINQNAFRREMPNVVDITERCEKRPQSVLRY